MNKYDVFKIIPAGHDGWNGSDCDDHSDQAAQEDEDVALVDGRVIHGLGDLGSQVFAQLVQALVEPQERDDGVVHLVESGEVFVAQNSDVDLGAGSGGEGCASGLQTNIE